MRQRLLFTEQGVPRELKYGGEAEATRGVNPNDMLLMAGYPEVRRVTLPPNCTVGYVFDQEALQLRVALMSIKKSVVRLLLPMVVLHTG